MKNTMSIGRWGATSVLVVAMSTQIFLNLPRSVTEIAGTAAWILLIYTGLLALVAFSIINLLYERFEGKDILDISGLFAGKTGMFFAGIIYFGYFLFITPVVLREFAEDLKIIAFTESPISYLSVFLVAGIAASAYFGLETVARVCSIIVPAIIFGIIIIGIAVSQFNDFHRLMPVMGNGPYNVFVKGLPRISIYSGIIELFLITPSIKTKSNFRFAGYVSLLLSIFFMVISTLAYLFVYEFPTSTEFFVPIFMLARMINYGRFFQRIESIFMLVWVSSALIYLSITFYLMLETFRKGCGIRNYKPLIPAFALIVFTISFMPKSLISTLSLEVNIFRTFAGAVTYGVTALILLIAVFSGKGKRKEADTNEH